MALPNVSFVGVIFAFIPLLLFPKTFAQDPGFFLDDWQEKSAQIPDYEIIPKSGNSTSVNILVDMDHVQHKVPAYVYGNNAVAWGGNMNEHETVMTDLKNLDPHVLRWPGGNLSQVYFWNLSSDQRPSDIPAGLNPWYGQNEDNWQMSTSDYYDLLANTNSTGSICVNLSYARYGTGPNPVNKAAHMAAEWVRYDNGRSKFWELGNENFGNWEAGYKIDVANNQDGQPEYISGQLYGQYCRVFIDSMRAAATENGMEIKIGVVAYDAESSYDPIQTVWNEGMMPEVGDIADFLIVHSYFTPYNKSSTISTILNSHHVPAEIMTVMVDDMAEAGNPMIPVAFTEWNIFAVGGMRQVSYINGMHSALVLGEFIKEDYGLATRWDLTNGWNDEGNDHGMFSRGGEPGVDYYNPRPVFFYMYYFQKYFGDRMVQSSVEGNNAVVAYASSFTSGEAGLVIINKSTSAETALVEIENFTPGMRYYTHTLTGGTDNGDFSRKVFLNGYGTDEQGGGPDAYESVKALAFEVEGGIKAELPPLSVVYLMVDKKPPLSYLSSRIDSSATVISVELSDAVVLAEGPTGFEVVANGSFPLPITLVEIDTVKSNLVYLHLDQEVRPSDTLTLSYSGNNISSLDSLVLAPFSMAPVQNLLPGAIPQLISAYTSQMGDVICLLFNMAMEVEGSSVDSFLLMTGDETTPAIAFTDVRISTEDSTKLVLMPALPMVAEYDLFLSYSGSSLMSLHGAAVESFDSLHVTNQATGISPVIVSAEVADYGLTIRVEFSKPMNDLSSHIPFFELRVNGESSTIGTIQSSAHSMVLTPESYIRFADTVTLSYNGITVASVDGGVLQPVANLTVKNALPEPEVILVPGMIDAELFAINFGMVPEPTSDTGGGNNLGYIDAGDWLEFEIDVLHTGYYTGGLRLAAANNMGQLQIQTSDGVLLDLATVTIPVTGGWQEWTTLPLKEILLHEGRQRLRLKALTSDFNLNWLNLELDRTVQAVLLSAATNEAGDTITLVFDKELAVPGSTEYTWFDVVADGQIINVSRLTLKNDDKTMLLLALETPLSADHELITVSYGAGNLRATDRTPVVSFSNMPVVNQVITTLSLPAVPEASFYPNPVKDMLNVRISGSKSDLVTLQIIDAMGRTRFLQEYPIYADNSMVQVDMSLLQEGIYLVRLSNDRMTVYHRIMVE